MIDILQIQQYPIEPNVMAYPLTAELESAAFLPLAPAKWVFEPFAISLPLQQCPNMQRIVAVLIQPHTLRIARSEHSHRGNCMKTRFMPLFLGDANTYILCISPFLWIASAASRNHASRCEPPLFILSIRRTCRHWKLRLKGALPKPPLGFTLDPGGKEALI